MKRKIGLAEIKNKRRKEREKRERKKRRLKKSKLILFFSWEKNKLYKLWIYF